MNNYLTFIDFYCVTRFNNWGRWGKDDQFGTLNFIDNSKRKEATQLVRTGNTVSCGRALNIWPGPDNCGSLPGFTF